MAIFDLHLHTVRGSSDSGLTTDQLIQEAQRIGLDGVCLTEHSGGWEAAELASAFKGSGLTAIRALEVNTDMGHILAFGLHRYVSGMHTAAGLRKVVDRAGGVMISAHPFRNFFNRPPYNLNLLFKSANGVRPTTAIEAVQASPIRTGRRRRGSQRRQHRPRKPVHAGRGAASRLHRQRRQRRPLQARHRQMRNPVRRRHSQRIRPHRGAQSQSLRPRRRLAYRQSQAIRPYRSAQ